MENAATINSTVTDGGTINTTVQTGSTVASTLAGGGIGPAGPTGPSGPSGPSGPTGAASSVPGPSGPSGPTGHTGACGVSGANGVSGVSGVSGVAGACGVSGTTGVGGACGVSGVAGACGVSGTAGTNGACGVSGVAGACGVSGTTGACGVSGVSGVAGGATNWLGAYSSGTTYHINDAVSSNGSSYICIATTTGNAPPNATFWSLLAQEGACGVSGTAGVAGACGVSGVAGSNGACGVSGVAGTNGACGVSGVAGACGVSGVAGACGVSGTTGACGVSGVAGSTATSTPTASTAAAWDASVNMSANAFFEKFTTTATAVGTTTMTITSTQIQEWTGSTTQTIKLPTTGVPAGAQYLFINDSTGIITIQSSGANTIITLAAGTACVLTALVATPTTAANWSFQYVSVVAATGKKATISNNLTFAGTDGTTMTFPSTTSTVMTLASTDTITGAKTFSTAPVLNALPTGTAVASAATASTLASRDSSGNLSANNVFDGFTTTATAAGTTTMTIASTEIQVWTGSTTQIVKLPTTSVPAGGSYTIINNSTGAVTVESSGANSIVVLGAGDSAIFTSLVATPTTAANWNYQYIPNNAGNRAWQYLGSATLSADFSTSTAGAFVAVTGLSVTVTVPTTAKQVRVTAPLMLDNSGAGYQAAAIFNGVTNLFQQSVSTAGRFPATLVFVLPAVSGSQTFTAQIALNGGSTSVKGAAGSTGYGADGGPSQLVVECC